MTNYYNPSSRLGRKKIKQAYSKILLATFLTIALITGVICLGIPFLIKLSGFLGNRSSPESITDTTPPFPPRLEPVSEATNSAELTVKGFSEPNSLVEIFINGESYQKVSVTNEGIFEVSIDLNDGENRILAQATDNAKNVSQPSTTLFINYQKKEPKLEISEPENNIIVKNDKRIINIEGITNVDNSVNINGRYVIVDQEGAFSYPYTLNDGENIIKIQAFDSAGNQKTVERKITYSP